MTTDDLDPRQALGRKLREVRDAAGLQAKDVAAALSIHPGLASRFELGQRWPKPEHMTGWARAAGLDEAATADLLRMLDEAKIRDRANKAVAAYGPKAAQERRNKLLASAKEVQTFAIAEIPFYLQRPEYARQELGDTPDANAIATLRTDADALVGRPGTTFRIILAESVLRFLPCDTAAMRAQISHLHSLIGRPGVEFGIIPFGIELVTPLKNAFTVFDAVTVVDTYAGEVTLTPREAARYTDLMGRLWDDSVQGEAARAHLTAAANALTVV